MGVVRGAGGECPAVRWVAGGVGAAVTGSVPGWSVVLVTGVAWAMAPLAVVTALAPSSAAVRLRIGPGRRIVTVQRARRASVA